MGFRPTIPANLSVTTLTLPNAGSIVLGDVTMLRSAAGRLQVSGELQTGGGIKPSTPLPALQTSTNYYGGAGAPNNAQGANGDLYLRSDGAALSTIYHKRAGVWVGIV